MRIAKEDKQLAYSSSWLILLDKVRSYMHKYISSVVPILQDLKRLAFCFVRGYYIFGYHCVILNEEKNLTNVLQYILIFLRLKENCV